MNKYDLKSLLENIYRLLAEEDMKPNKPPVGTPNSLEQGPPDPEGPDSPPKDLPQGEWYLHQGTWYYLIRNSFRGPLDHEYEWLMWTWTNDSGWGWVRTTHPRMNPILNPAV